MECQHLGHRPSRAVGWRDAGRGRLSGGADGIHVWCSGGLDRVGADGRPGGAQDGPGLAWGRVTQDGAQRGSRLGLVKLIDKLTAVQAAPGPHWTSRGTSWRTRQQRTGTKNQWVGAVLPGHRPPEPRRTLGPHTCSARLVSQAYPARESVRVPPTQGLHTGLAPGSYICLPPAHT